MASVTLALGDVAPSNPRTFAGNTVGAAHNAAAETVVFKKFRREYIGKRFFLIKTSFRKFSFYPTRSGIKNKATEVVLFGK
jgi:hypothetical protein